MILLAVAGVTLVTTLSCGTRSNEAWCDDDSPKPPEAQPANNLELRGDRNTRIRAIEVERGGTAEFKVTNGTAYILIPDPHLTVINGGIEVPAVGSILAFIVDDEGATITVPKDYPKSDRATVIHYSVLCFDKKGGVYYAEDESPPGIIIPKLP